jgi:hypothetical protein
MARIGDAHAATAAPGHRRRHASRMRILDKNDCGARVR